MRILLASMLGIALAFAACQEKGVKTEHGFRVVLHTKNEGPKAQEGDQTLISVTTFIGDSLMGSTAKMGGPREFVIHPKEKLGKRVPPIYDALLMMAKGDSATVYQELDSLMQKTLPPALRKEKFARYELVLVNIKSKADMEAATKGVKDLISTTMADYTAGTLGDKLKKSASGLEYVILEQGEGEAVKDGEQVPTNYYGVLKANGEMFDNSYDRGAPAPFTVGAMIPGFNEGMKLLNRGGKAVLFIPAKLGYGAVENGPIPANSDLVFYVALEK